MKLPSSSRHQKLFFTAKISPHCPEKSEFRARCSILNEQFSILHPAQLCKGLPKTGAVWRSKALLKSEIMFLSADLKNEERIFSLSSAPDQTQTSFPLPQSPGKEGHLQPSAAQEKSKISINIHLFCAGNPRIPPKPTMGCPPSHTSPEDRELWMWFSTEL